MLGHTRRDGSVKKRERRDPWTFFEASFVGIIVSPSF
jgi:hypothetical protein